MMCQNLGLIVAIAIGMSACSSTVREIPNVEKSQAVVSEVFQGARLTLSWKKGDKEESTTGGESGVLHLPPEIPTQIKFQLDCAECEFDGVSPDVEARVFSGTDSLEVTLREVLADKGSIRGVIEDANTYFFGIETLKRSLEIVIRPNPSQTVVRRFELRLPPTQMETSFTKGAEFSSVVGAPLGFEYQHLMAGVLNLDLVGVLKIHNPSDEIVSLATTMPQVSQIRESWLRWQHTPNPADGGCSTLHVEVPEVREVVGTFYTFKLDHKIKEAAKLVALGKFEASPVLDLEISPKQDAFYGIYVRNSKLNSWMEHGYPYESNSTAQFPIRCEKVCVRQWDNPRGDSLKGPMDGDSGCVEWETVKIFGPHATGNRTTGVTLHFPDSVSAVEVRHLNSPFSRTLSTPWGLHRIF